MNLVNNGKLTFPVYHQTSSLFIDSIQKFGFCGVNIIQKMEVLESLEKLISYSDEKGLAVDPILRRMLNQECNQYSNFRHGGGYVTPSQASAVRYATGNSYGSELISNVLEFVVNLTEQGHAVDSLVNKELLDLQGLTQFPVLLKVEAAPVSLLQGEKKESFESVIDDICTMIGSNTEVGSPLFHAMTQQTNFEVFSAIDVSKIEFYRIIFEEPVDPVFPRYALEPIA